MTRSPLLIAAAEYAVAESAVLGFDGDRTSDRVERRPTLIMVGDIPLVALAAFERLHPRTQRAIRSIEAELEAGNRQAAVRKVIDLEASMGITADDRIASMGPSSEIEALLEQGLSLAMGSVAPVDGYVEPAAANEDERPDFRPDRRPEFVKYAIEQFALARRHRLQIEILKDKNPTKHKAKIERLERLARQADANGARAQTQRDDVKWAAAALEETIAQAKLQGEEITAPKHENGSRKPARRVTGIDWLASKGRITPTQVQAAERYADDYRAATDVSIPSGLRDSFGAGNVDMIQERRQKAKERLARAHAQLGGHPGMIAICTAVIGKGQRVRAYAKNDEVEAHKQEAILLIALDLLAKHYGIL